MKKPRRRLPFDCPRCDGTTAVAKIVGTVKGLFYRRRKCPDCDYRFFTAAVDRLAEEEETTKPTKDRSKKYVVKPRPVLHNLTERRKLNPDSLRVSDCFLDWA